MARHKMLAPIVSRKHYAYRTNTAVASGAAVTTTLVDAVVAPAQTAATNVVEGAVVKAVYCEFWVKSNASAGTDTQFDLYIYKTPAGATAMTFAETVNAGAFLNKKNILYSTQGVIGDLTTQAIPLIREWIKIPKGKQRFGLGDKFHVTFSTTGDAAQFCGFVTFKEYI